MSSGESTYDAHNPSSREYHERLESLLNEPDDIRYQLPQDMAAAADLERRYGRAEDV